MSEADEKKIALEDDIQVQKLICKTLLPNFTPELSLSATSIVDGAIVGYFYGSQGLAAVGAGGPILSVFTIAAGIIGTGNSVICSNLIGRASKGEINKAFSLSILWARFPLSTAVTSSKDSVLFSMAREE